MALLMRFVVVSLPASSRSWKNPRISRSLSRCAVHFRAEESGQQVVPGGRPPVLQQFSEVDAHLVRYHRELGNRRSCGLARSHDGVAHREDRVIPAHEPGPIRDGDAEHLGDHHHRQWDRELGGQIHCPAPNRPVQQLAR